MKSPDNQLVSAINNLFWIKKNFNKINYCSIFFIISLNLKYSVILSQVNLQIIKFIIINVKFKLFVFKKSIKKMLWVKIFFLKNINLMIISIIYIF